jgi:CheY-like chemotaxis protein
MEELSELKGQFLASLNHEVRTPLSGIVGMTDLLLETSLSEEQREYVGATRLCAESLLEILNVTLEFSALAVNNVRLEETEFSLRETLDSVVSEFAFKAESKGLRLVRNFDPSLPEAVVCDALRLRQMLWHLVGNGVKFTNLGTVEVGASASPAVESAITVTIQIRDTGIGIASDQIGSIFESFRHLEAGLARNHPGLGLGLAVAQQLATLLGGRIEVQSEVGRGSTFTVRLPLRLPVDAAQRGVDSKRVRGRVLVVDDNLVAQTIASHALRRNAFEVECVGDGIAALEAVARSTFDVILMDLQMPGLDGFETALRIRLQPGCAGTPIIAVTANCSSDNRDRCVECGMQGFLGKPVRTRELVQTVEKFLSSGIPELQ